MTISKDLINSINTNTDFTNFSEEVEIISSSKTGSNTLYTIKNKNGTIFQNVPGANGFVDRGILGFINGDRARPIMISGMANSSKTTTTTSTLGIDLSSDLGMTNANGLLTNITNPGIWDIELEVSNAVSTDSVIGIQAIIAF